jgi:hypothetical protein
MTTSGPVDPDDPAPPVVKLANPTPFEAASSVAFVDEPALVRRVRNERAQVIRKYPDAFSDREKAWAEGRAVLASLPDIVPVVPVVPADPAATDPTESP